MRAWAAVLGFLVPGFGHAMVRKRWSTLAWAGAGLVTVPLALVTVWMMWIAIAVRLAAGVDGARCVHRDRAIATWWGVLPAIALIAGAVAGGIAELSLEGFAIPTSSMYPTLAIGDHIYIDKLARHPDRGDLIVHAYPCDPDNSYVKRVVGLPGDTVEVRCNILYINGNPAPSELVAGACSYDERDERGWQSRACSRYRETLDGHTYDTFHDPDRPSRHDVAADRDFPRLASVFAPSCRQGDFGRPSIDQALGTLVATKPEGAATPCEPQLHYLVPAESVFVLGDNRSNSADSRHWGAVPLHAVKGRVIGIWWSHGKSLDLGRIGAVR